MDLIEYEGGEILANLEDRTITGLLLPYNELGQTNAGRFMVEAGTFPELPADPAVIGINTDHERSQPVGRATRVWEEPTTGIMATFAIARTPEGDAALADAISPTGKRKRLSAEFHTAIKAGKAVPGTGRLWGAALVGMGAFPSAMVLAADRSSRYSSEFTDEDGVTWVRKETSETTTTETENGTETTTVTTVTEESTQQEEQEEPMGDTTATVEAQVRPATPTASGAPAARTAAVNLTHQVLAAVHALKTNPLDGAAHQVLAAIADVKMSGTGALPGTNVLRENWLGQLYQGIEYVRQFLPLGNTGTDISAAGKRGFRVFRGTAASPLGPQDGSWAGNKTAINGYPGGSDTIGSLLYRFAVGNDIDRSLFDLPGGVEVVEAFLRLIIEDHLFWSDRIAREAWVSAAGNPVNPNTAAYPTNYPPALGQLIQGILAVKKRKGDQRSDVPTFAIANDRAFEQLAYAAGGEQNLPAFVSIAMSTNREGTVDGTVQIVNGDTGTSGSPSVIVGTGNAIDFDELAGGPLIIDAVDLAKGGIDKATHGYLQVFSKRPEAVVHVGAKDAWTATTPEPVGSIVSLGAGVVQAILPTTQIAGAAFVGTTGSAAPTLPGAVGGTVTDGTVNWRRIA
ncbi:hypothetical protein SK224_00240 [Microbacterium sp. BG28]|uniref:hypothetical protein n=1 Tax=Microbacterium sp. BG28 TaxID=3097356 RepID=UPI002A5A0CC2|nr:hypothetical protein [Microbacterium sp. BG28]MDY0827548.1 hypothetical protein [Microbacterium sp. BG28]